MSEFMRGERASKSLVELRPDMCIVLSVSWRRRRLEVGLGERDAGLCLSRAMVG